MFAETASLRSRLTMVGLILAGNSLFISFCLLYDDPHASYVSRNIAFLMSILLGVAFLYSLQIIISGDFGLRWNVVQAVIFLSFAVSATLLATLSFNGGPGTEDEMYWKLFDLNTTGSAFHPISAVFGAVFMFLLHKADDLSNAVVDTLRQYVDHRRKMKSGGPVVVEA